MQRRWPQDVDFMRMHLPTDSFWPVFPLLFRSYFAHISDNDLLPFVVGCKLLVLAATTADQIFDSEFPPQATAELLLRWQGLQFELHRNFSKIFDAQSVFWLRLQEYLAEYTRCISLELHYRNMKRRLADSTDEECILIAKSKTCLSRIAVVGLSVLSGDWRATDRLLLSLDHFNVAKQLFDDLLDWKADFGAPTLLMSRLARSGIDVDGCHRERDNSAIAREIYYRGHAEESLEIARDHVQRALEAAVTEPRSPWLTVIERVGSKIECLQLDLQKLVAENIANGALSRKGML